MNSLKKFLLPVLLLILLFVPLLDLFHPGLPLTHDGQDHLARIANFFINLEYGIVIPRWAPNLNWGYGHPVLEFLYPFPSYLASFFHFLGFSFINSAKIVFGLGIFLSGISMYWWLANLLGKRAGFIGALLYVFAPYRFIELYVRGDIGENLAFIFIPLVLLLIDKNVEESKVEHVLLGALFLALLILSHNAISLMFLPIITFYALYKYIYVAKNKRQFAFSFLAMIALGFGLSAFFWLPAFFEGKFTLRNIVTAGVYKTRFVTLSQLFYGPWSYLGTGQFTVQLGIMQWMMFISSICLMPFFWQKKNKAFWLVVLMIIFSLISIFLMLPMSDFIWKKSLLLQNFQFPWRFLAILVFTPAVLGAVLLNIIPKRLQIGTLIICTALLLFFNKDYWHANGFLYKPDSFFTTIYNGTTDTGESSPIWSVRFMEKRPKSALEIISGKAKVQEIKRIPTDHIYNIQALTQAEVVENTLYFPGWSVVIDGKKVPIEFQNQLFRGLMTFSVPQGTHEIDVSFTETKLRILSDIITICSVLALCGMSIKKKFL